MLRRKKRFVCFVLYDGKNYFCKEASDLGMDILGMLLGIDVRCFGVETYFNMVKKDRDSWTQANATFVKIENDVVSIGDMLEYCEKEYEEDLCETFDLPREKFMYLLDQWNIYTKLKPKEIIVTVDGDDVTVEGRNELKRRWRAVSFLKRSLMPLCRRKKKTKKKESIIFKSYEKGLYCFSLSLRGNIGTLGSFLRGEVQDRFSSFFAAWIDDLECDGVLGDRIGLTISANREMIEMRVICYGGEDRPVFTLSRNQYIKVLWLWHAECKRQSKEIVLSWDGQEILLRGRN